MKIKTATEVRHTGGGGHPLESEDVVANRMLEAILKSHPSARILSCRSIDVSKFYWELMEIKYIYDDKAR